MRDAIAERLARADVRALLAGLAVAVATCIAGYWGASLIVHPQNVAPFWPLAGVAVGAILATSGKLRVACLIGALIGVLAFNVWLGYGAATSLTFVSSHALELFCIERLVARWIGVQAKLDSLRKVVAWLAIIIASVAAAGALVGVILPLTGHSSDTFGGIWLTWFASHIVGILFVAPLLMALSDELETPRRIGFEDAEGAVALLIALVASVVLLAARPAAASFTKIALLAAFFPLLFWAAVRCRPVCVSAAALVVGLFTIFGLTTGNGPFSDGTFSVQNRIASAQFFIFSIVLCALVVSAMVQERLRTQVELNDALQRNELALAAGNTGTWSFDPATGVIDLDQRARGIWGIAAGAVVRNAELDALLHPEDQPARRSALRNALSPKGAGRLEIEYRLRSRDDQPERWVVVRGQTEFDIDRPRRMFGTVRDITARRVAEDMVARSKDALEAEVKERTHQLEAVLESALSAILTIDSTGVIQSVNAATVKLFGYARNEMLGHNVKMLMPERDSSLHDGYLKTYMETGQKKIIGIGREVVALRKDGTNFPIHLAISEFDVNGVRYITGIVTDLTDRAAAHSALQESERKLSQAQKMEAIGQLSGGIAHDFNNLLTIITGNLELLDMRLEDEQSRDLVRRAQDAARRGARLTERLSTFSRRRALRPVVLSLNETAIGMTDLMRRTLGGNVTVNTDLAPELWTTFVDPSEIENAILNLAINARDAMPGGGQIVIETANAVLSKADVIEGDDAEPGDYVKLSVCDTGTGMSRQVAARAFEPFFTTKEQGRGTGLGLSTIYGFVRQSGGHVTIDSEVGKGTTVSLFLPRDISNTKSASVSATTANARPATGERILVVEDNDEVRELAARHLHQLGYRTVVAENGPAAIEILESDDAIDLVFTDVVMPGGMTGFSLARWVQQHRPGLPVVITSGFAPEENPAGPAIGGDFAIQTPLLRKPYSQTELADVIRDALQS